MFVKISFIHSLPHILIEAIIVRLSYEVLNIKQAETYKHKIEKALEFDKLYLEKRIR